MLQYRKQMLKCSKEYECSLCNYSCKKQSVLDKHFKTNKHKLNTGIVVDTPSVRTTDKKLPYECTTCTRNYTNYKSYYSHKTKCESSQNKDDVVHALLKETQELRNLIVEQSKITNNVMNKALELCKPVNNNNNNTTINQTNNNNQRFNINLFLNEQCKDAINFSDFVKNIQISYEDLENNAQLGFVNGISKIFLDNLKQLDVTERPIHCTDMKRETMYIKDENTWTKQPDDEKLQKAIQTVSYRSMGKLAEWKNENPEYKDCNSEFSQKCLDIQRQTLAGSDRGVYYPKVIHALARETVVDK